MGPLRPHQCDRTNNTAEGTACTSDVTGRPAQSLTPAVQRALSGAPHLLATRPRGRCGQFVTQRPARAASMPPPHAPPWSPCARGRMLTREIARWPKRASTRRERRGAARAPGSPACSRRTITSPTGGEAAHHRRRGARWGGALMRLGRRSASSGRRLLWCRPRLLCRLAPAGRLSWHVAGRVCQSCRACRRREGAASPSRSAASRAAWRRHAR